MENSKLPADLQGDIIRNAQLYTKYGDKPKTLTEAKFLSYKAGATEWAEKWWEVKQENEKLKAALEKIQSITEDGTITYSKRYFSIVPIVLKALASDGKDGEETNVITFEQWVKENATQLGETHWVVGIKHIYGKADLRRVYERFTNQSKR